MSTCSHCGAPLSAQCGDVQIHCSYCRADIVTAAGPDGVTRFEAASNLLCPLCHGPLHHAAIGNLAAESCPRCLGVLVETAIFLAVVEELRLHAERRNFPAPLSRASARRLECPRCGKTMDAHPYAGPGAIWIDNCPGCSVNWLDAGELQRIAQAPFESWRREYEES